MKSYVELLPSPFYRVTVKALVRDEQDRVLLIQAANGEWELPGGGWEHHEDFTECLDREFAEELGVGLATLGDIVCVYRGAPSWGSVPLRILVTAQPDSLEFRVGEGMKGAAYVTREEFLQTTFAAGEAAILDFVDKIWPKVE